MAGRGQAGWRSSRWRMGNAAPAQALPPLLTAGAPPTEQPQAPPRGRRSIRATATAVFAPVARAGGAIIEDVLPWPWQGVRFSPAYVAFLTYVFVVTSYVVPLAQAAMVCAIGILTFGSKDRWKVPGPMAMLLAFFMFAALGYKMTRYAVYTWDPLMDLAKVVIVAWVAVSVLSDRARLRFFIFFYLGVFALFPVRGALFNKFIYHADTQGRVAWNNLFANPNDLAALIIFPLGLAAALFFTERQQWVRRCAVLGVVILPLVIFMTQSRGAILALGVTLMFYIVIQGKGRGRTIMALGAAALVVTIFAPSTVWNRLSSLKSAAESGKVEDAKDDNSAEQRLAIMKVAADVAKAYPVMGVGWGAYPNANGEFARRSKYSELAKGDRDAHNTYLTVAAETGFIGLALWLATIFMCVNVALKGMREVRPYVPEYALQIKFVLLTLLAYGLSGIFGSFAHMNSTYLHLMTVFALGHMARQEAATRAAAAGGGGMAMASGRRGRS